MFDRFDRFDNQSFVGWTDRGGGAGNFDEAWAIALDLQPVQKLQETYENSACEKL